MRTWQKSSLFFKKIQNKNHIQISSTIGLIRKIDIKIIASLCNLTTNLVMNGSHALCRIDVRNDRQVSLFAVP